MNKIDVKNLQSKLNKKVLLGFFSIVMCLALIIACSFSAFIIDPTRWQTIEFLTDELIIASIVIMSMVSVMLMGQSSNAQNPLSRISKARVAFFDSFKIVEERNVNAFRQWVRKILQPEDLKTIQQRRLRKLGIDDLTILDLEYSEIQALDKPQKYNGKFYKSLTEEQIKGVINIKKSKYKIKFVEPEYYLSVKNLIDNRTVSERAVHEGRKKGTFLSFRIVGRLMITIVSAMIFASLVRDMSTQIDQAAAWAKFFARVWAMLSSSFMGYTVGTQMNDIDAEYIEMRVQVHKRYLQDNEFKPLTEEEEAKQEFIDRVTEEQVLQLENKQNQIEMKE